MSFFYYLDNCGKGLGRLPHFGKIQMEKWRVVDFGRREI